MTAINLIQPAGDSMIAGIAAICVTVAGIVPAVTITLRLIARTLKGL